MLSNSYKSKQVFGSQGPTWEFYGPGIDGLADTPTRYFYGIYLEGSKQIDARTFKKEEIKFDLFHPKTGKKIWSDKEFGHKFDGTIIFRYRLRLSVPTGVLIKVFIKDKVVFESKYLNLF